MTTETLTLTHLSDGSHGWLVLHPQVLCKLDLRPSDFSRCSYLGPDGTVYAEEDCDALIVTEQCAELGIEVTFTQTETRGEAHCRRYARCGA